MRQHNTNILLRLGIADLGLRNWEAAEILGISDSYFSKIIRTELPISEQMELLQKIREGGKR